VDGSATGAEPSIRSRTLYIPINAWFCLNSKCALPLVALQYNTIEITVILRPIQDLFQIRDVFDTENNFPYIRPDFTRQEFQLYRFLQTPPDIVLTAEKYYNQLMGWNADIHLVANYCFLSKAESALFAARSQSYLIKDIYEYSYANITGSQRLKLTSMGMVASWMFYLQRNDVNLRNEWSNYTNWPYNNIPDDIVPAPFGVPITFHQSAIDANIVNYKGDPIGPLTQPALFTDNPGKSTGFFTTGSFSPANLKNILVTFGVLINGEYRETTLPREIFDYIEKYTRSTGGAKDGLYMYQFGLHSNATETQPSGALNMSHFRTVELEVTTIPPPLDPTSNQFQVICDASGVSIGVNKQNYKLYQYNYNLVLFEERYNILSFVGGYCGLMYAR
jgi:hypothetical protein